MLRGIFELLLFQFLGFLVVSLLALPIPSPVMGLLLLFLSLLLRGNLSDPLVKVSSVLLPLLPLFLIPASAAIIQHKALLLDDGVAITTAIVVSLVVTIIATPYIFYFFIKLFGKPHE